MTIPPPLAPPHKGEGVPEAFALGGERAKRSERQAAPLPLVGRGKGWGCGIHRRAGLA